MNINKELFLSFCKIGIFMFGGGYSMLPVLEHEIINKKKWLTQEEILDLYALAQCTPGVIAVNTATKVGYKINGTIGAVFSTVGVVLPSSVIIVIIAELLNNLSYINSVQSILTGIRIAACAMMVNTLLRLLEIGIKNCFGAAIFILSALTVILFKISVVWIILFAIISGILYGKIKGGRNNDN